MRYILHEGSAATIPIEQEITIVEDYIALEKLRYDDRLQLHFEQDIDDPEQKIAPLILLPFVENAFKHGAGESRFGIRIDIRLTVQREELLFQVSNSCDEAAVLSEGIGLQNVKRQLELIYDQDHSLNIQPEKDAFCVTLKIHLNGKSRFN